MHDNEASKIARYVSGLRREIQDIVELYEYSLKKVVHLAIKVESQLLKKTTLKNTHHDGFYKSSWKDTNKNFTKPSPSNFSKETTSHQNVSKHNPSTSTPTSPTKTSRTKCFKYLGFGHIVANFPNKRVIKLQKVHQDHIKTKTKSENERAKKGQDNTSLIPSPQRCFSSLYFSLPKHSKYLTYLIKKFRNDIQRPPKGYHLLRGFFQNHFILKSSFQTWPVARIPPSNLLTLNEHKCVSHLPYTNHVHKLTMLFSGVLHSSKEILHNFCVSDLLLNWSYLVRYEALKWRSPFTHLGDSIPSSGVITLSFTIPKFFFHHLFH